MIRATVLLVCTMTGPFAKPSPESHVQQAIALVEHQRPQRTQRARHAAVLQQMQGGRGLSVVHPSSEVPGQSATNTQVGGYMPGHAQAGPKAYCNAETDNQLFVSMSLDAPYLNGCRTFWQYIGNWTSA